MFKAAAAQVAALLYLLTVTDSFPQSYPNGAIRIVVPFAAGGSADTHARYVGKHLTDVWGKQVFIDNRPGVGGSLGAGIVAKAPADGYTLLMGASPIAIAPSFFPNLGYDSVKDFAPITLLVFEPNILLVHPSLSVKSLGELITLIKNKPGQVNYASSGSGTSTHLSAEMFKTMAGLNIVHVAYKGNPPAITDLLSGRVSMMFLNGSTAAPLAQSGRLRAIAVGGSKRASALPEVPTVAESGLPGYESVAWSGIMAPAGTASDIINKLHLELNKLVLSTEMRQRLALVASEPGGQGPAEFNAIFIKDIERWAKVVKESGARPD